MIDTKKKLKETIKYERELYKKIGYKGKIHAFFSSCEVGYIFRYVEALRMDEYYTYHSNFLNRILAMYWRKRHNCLGIKLGISIPINTFEKGLKIYHSQGIIVHKDAKIGKNCCLHGMNCIGNNGTETIVNGVPIIGEDCDIGVGAVVIGNVKIGDNIKIAAGAVVCKSFKNDNCTLIGIPARSKLS